MKVIEINYQRYESKLDVPVVELWYPRLEENASEVEVGLSDVRAADSLRISYDFDRDGYVIKQASTFEWDADDDKCDMDWQEVAFISSWAREKPREREERP